MNSKIIVESIIKSKNGIAKVADLVEGGVSRQSIKKCMPTDISKESAEGTIHLLPNLYQVMSK